MNRDRVITLLSIFIIVFLLYWSRFQQGRTYIEMITIFTPAIVIPLIFSLIQKIRKRSS